MEALEQVKTVGLKHLLPGKQTAGHAKKGVAEQGCSHQQQGEGLWPAGGPEHNASENGTKEGATHIPHEDFCWAPIPDQKAKQGTHQGPEGGHAGEGSNREQNGHAAGNETIQAVHKVREVDNSGACDQQKQGSKPIEVRCHGLISNNTSAVAT
jgi:hypothetical protein